METTITGTGVQLYMVPEYEIRAKYPEYLSSRGHK